MKESLCELKARAVAARERLRAYVNAPIAEREQGVGFFDLAAGSNAAMSTLREAVVLLTDDECALKGLSPAGNLVLLNRSAKHVGMWQVTRFTTDGMPDGDVQYSSKKTSIREFLQDIRLQSLESFDGHFRMDSQNESGANVMAVSYLQGNGPRQSKYGLKCG